MQQNKKHNNLWEFMQSTWQTRACVVFSILWFYFAVMAVYTPEMYPLYTYYDDLTNTVISVFSEKELWFYGAGIVSGIIGYLVGLIWILKKCRNDYSGCTHWVDLVIQRILYGIVFVIIACISIGSLVSIYSELPIAATVFIVMWVISFIVAFCVSRLFVKQSLIAEANIKAKEMYNGRKRSIFYRKDN